MFSHAVLSNLERQELAFQDMLERERAKREKERQKAAHEVISSIKETLPSDFEKWLETRFPKAIFYAKVKRGKYRAICEECNTLVDLTRVRADKIECPHCGAKVEPKSFNKFFVHGYCLGGIFALVEKHGNGWVQRMFFIDKRMIPNLDGVVTVYTVKESERWYLSESTSDEVWCFHKKKDEEEWLPGQKQHASGWSAWRMGERPMATYPFNLTEIFHDSKYQYSAIEQATALGLVNPFDYILKYNDHPELERLYKIGLVGCARHYFQSRWWRGPDALNRLAEAKNLKDLGIDNKVELAECRNLGIFELIARKEVKRWRIDPADRAEAIKFIVALNNRSGEDFNYSFITRERLFKYFKEQGYNDPTTFFNDYIRDYIPDCIKLGLNLNDTAINRPRDFNKMHQWLTEELKLQETQVYDALIEATYDAIHHLVEWQHKELCVIMPRTSKEIMEEGNRQDHCVGKYCERVAKGESVILFVRRTENPEEPYFTLEIKKDMQVCDIVQCRGKSNSEQTPEIEKFLKQYKRWFNRRPIGDYNGDNVMVRYYKAVHKRDGKYISNFDNTTEFSVGEVVTAELNDNPDAVAVKGLHVASLEFAQQFGGHWKDVAILEVETNIHDVVVPNAKDQVRTSRFRVLREVPMLEMGEWGAQRLRDAG